MKRLVAQIQALVRELRRRQVIRVAVVYATTGFVILQLAEILVEPFGLGPRALRLITLVLILGFPLAVGLAWVYNLTDEGVVEVEDEGTQDPSSDKSTATSNGLIVGLLVVAIGLLLYPRLFSSGDQASDHAPAANSDTAQIEERSIAVLPFDPLSSGEESETFARGVHDDLLTRLSNIGDLKVISRTSVEKYRDTDLSIPAIADSLGVRWVVEGGVLESGGRVQVNAQLIDPRTDAHRWAESYERPLTAENLFAVQGEITQEIAKSLEATLTAGEQERTMYNPTGDLDAYRLFVRGRRLLDQRSQDALRSAIQKLGRAIEQDSSFAPAWAAFGEGHALLGGYGHAPRDSVFPRAWEATRRARTLDPSLADAHVSAGLLYSYEHKGPAALRELRKALELRPSLARAHRWLGVVLQALGHPNSLEHYRRAVELNPLSAEGYADLAGALMGVGKYGQALRHARTAKSIEPEYGLGRRMEIVALYRLGRLDEAESMLQSNSLSRGYYSPDKFRALIHVASGDTARARRVLARLRKTDDLYSAGVVHASLGEVDAAFRAFQKVRTWDIGRTIEVREAAVGLVPLQDDPRYNDLIQEINVYWGLNPDGSTPDSTDASNSSSSEADA